MNNNILGKEIIKLRKELSLTQKQLCEGICTQPTISMIENGEIIPGLDILISISEKLKRPISYFINLLLIHNYEYIHKFVNDIEELTINREFNYVYKIVKKELENGSHEQNKWFEIFLYWQYYLSSFHLSKISLEEAIIKIKDLYINAPNIVLNRNFLSARILNTLAFLYALKKDYQKSLFYFNKITNHSYQSQSARFNEEIYHLRILYNKTKTLYDMGNYSEAVISCKHGIKKSISLENMSEIGNFYYYLGQCYEKQNAKKETISIQYQKALFFFEILNREGYIKVLKTDKAIYLTGN